MRYNRDNYSPRRRRTPYTRGNRHNISSQNDSGGKPKHTQQPSRTQTVTNNAPTAHTPPQEMVQLASLLKKMMQQTHQVQQPPPLPAPPPCAPGLQPQPLLRPRVSSIQGHPPMMFGQLPQGFYRQTGPPADKSKFSNSNRFLLEKWFPLQGERGHSSYFRCFQKQNREEGETE